MKLSKKQKELIIEGHEAACTEWKERIEKGFPKLFKSEFKEGEWVRLNKKYGNIVKISEVRNDGWFWGEQFPEPYLTDGAKNFHNPRVIKRKATHEEIAEHLIEEAKRRGFLGKVTISKDTLGYSSVGWYYDIEFNGKASYNIRDDELIVRPSYDTIYSRGKWAEIINTTITKEEAEKRLNVKIID